MLCSKSKVDPTDGCQYGSQGCLVEQRQMRLLNLVDFWALGVLPMRAQIEVLRQNRSFSGTTEIPNSLKIPSKFPKITSISSFVFLAFEFPETKARNFKVTILMKSKLLRTGIFSKIQSYTCNSQPHNIHLLPTHCMHPSTMNVPELKLPLSSSSICSVSSMTDEDEEDKEGDEEGSQTINNNNNNNNNNNAEDNEKEQEQEESSSQQ